MLTLKLIRVVTSVYDAKTGKKVDKKSSVDSLFALTSSKIQVLEVMGFCCLFCTSIIGPQLSFHHYREIVNGTLNTTERRWEGMCTMLSIELLSLSYIA